MRKWVNKLLGIDVLEQKIQDTEKALAQERENTKKLKSKVEEQKPTAKQLADAAREPYVSILRVDIDPEQPGNGSFEIDWNEYFVQKLIRHGYTGKTDEQIVDQWFQEVCRQVVLETYEQFEANNPSRVTRKDLGDGRSEVS